MLGRITNQMASGRTQHTWHIPVFVLGLATLTGVCLFRPLLLRGAEERRVERQLAEARELLDNSDGDLDRVVKLTQAACALSDRRPRTAAVGHFLAGCAYLKKAEREPSAEATEDSLNACYHLEQAEALGVPDDDRPHLRYRLGKAWYRTGHEPAAIIEHWKDSIPRGADDPAEAYDLLAHAYLRLPSPDLDAALEANTQLLRLPLDEDRILSPARLFRGELLLKLHRPDEARDVLRKLGVNAPPGLAAQARFLRAGCSEEEQHWAEALALWQETLADVDAPPKHLDEVYYHLGLCHRKLDHSQEASKAWQECLRISQRDTGPAAAVGLAGLLLLRDHNPSAALEAYARALRDVSDPSSWRNSLVPLANVREELESGCHILRETGQYAVAIQLANLYEKLAPNGKAPELRGAAARQWGLARMDAARKPGVAEADRKSEEDEARALYRQAGEAFEKSADLTTTPTDQADRLWLGANCYLDAKESARAASAFERFLSLKNQSERIGEGWFRLAEARHDLHDEEAEQEAYRQCADISGHFACRARYRLAGAAVAKGELAQAESLLDKNLDSTDHDVDAETRQKSLFMLGDVHLQRHCLQSAIFRLEQALRDHPVGREAIQAQFQLAECYRLLAIEAAQSRDESKLVETRKFSEKQFREYLSKAAAKYQELADTLADHAKTRALTKDEEELFRVAAFTAARSHFNLSEYEEAGRLYDGLAVRYRDKIDSLEALVGVARCARATNDEKKAAAAIALLKQTLDALPDDQFTQDPEAWDRKKWQAWVNQAMKQTSRP
jgi:TolA-binding protein